MTPGDTPGGDHLERLLEALDEADGALRALYRRLAGDPGLDDELEPEVEELRARRRDLARQVGLAVLARKRASAQAAVPVPAETTVAPTAAATTEGEDASGAAPERSPEPELPPTAVPASDAQLARWKSAVRSAGLGAYRGDAPSLATAWPLVLHELMEILGPPRALDTSVGVIEEIDALDAVGTPDRQAQWARLPRGAQQAWLSLLVARTRAVKELPSTTEVVATKVKEIIARYPPWAKEHSPGHVNGMQLRHAPAHGSWAQDARAFWSSLDDRLGEEQGALRSPVSPKKKAKRAASDDADEPEVDAPWPLLPLTRGRSAILLGGDPREPNRERLERVLQLGSLEWPAIDGPRKVEAVVGRIRRRAYDLVLVLQPFVAHKESEPIIDAAKAAETPWALVEGYGAQAVKLGLERFLGGPR